MTSVNNEYAHQIGFAMSPDKLAEWMADTDASKFSANLSVINMNLTTPPGSPVLGDKHIVPAAGATGSWAGMGNRIACFVKFSTGNAWAFVLPIEGWSAYNRETGKVFQYRSSAWTEHARYSRTVFTASGTYTIPTWARSIRAVAIGGGGGGGGGRRGAAATDRFGGGGGGGGGVSVGDFVVASLAVTSLSVTVGAGGAGGAPGATDSTSGANATAGGISHVSKASPTVYLVRANGGASGRGGVSVTTASLQAGIGTESSWGNDGGAATVVGMATNSRVGPGGGGGGGRIDTANATTVSGNGGAGFSGNPNHQADGGSGASAISDGAGRLAAGAGSANATTLHPYVSGGGGGGGAAGTASTDAVHGGAGGLYGGGGGGGGPTYNGYLGGSGGTGAAGVVIIEAYS